MRKQSLCRVAVAFALVSGLIACSTAPPVASPPPDAVAGQAPVASVAPSGQEAEIPGYRRVVRDGETYYCQTRAVTGSRARSADVCMTREELLRMDEIREQYERNAAAAGGRSTFTLDSPN